MQAAADHQLHSTFLSSPQVTGLPEVASRRLPQIEENRGCSWIRTADWYHVSLAVWVVSAILHVVDICIKWSTAEVGYRRFKLIKNVRKGIHFQVMNARRSPRYKGRLYCRLIAWSSSCQNEPDRLPRKSSFGTQSRSHLQNGLRR